jgi:hypothetical protein
MSDSATVESEAPIERDAKIFEAGRYDDKDMEVTEGDLCKIAAAHKPVPIGYEHAGGKLRFGWLTKVWQTGQELWGRLSFSPRAFATAKECGLNRLSVTLPRDKSRLYGVDLVESPRVGDAAFEFAAVAFNVAESPAVAVAAAGSDTQESEVTKMAEETQTQDAMGLPDARRAFAESKAALESGELQKFNQDNIALARESRQMVIDAAKEAEANNAEFRAQRAEMIVDDWKQRGCITRAAEPKVRALMQHLPAKGSTVKEQDAIQFKTDNGEAEVAHWAQVVKEIIDANGPVIDLKERARAGQLNGMSTEDATNAAKFGYKPEEAAAIIAKHEGGAA